MHSLPWYTTVQLHPQAKLRIRSVFVGLKPQVGAIALTVSLVVQDVRLLGSHVLLGKQISTPELLTGDSYLQFCSLIPLKSFG